MRHESETRNVLTSLAEDVRGYVFSQLDSYFLTHEMDSEDAGRIAMAVALTYERELQQHFAIESDRI